MVLDVDSDQLEDFSDIDAEGLRMIVRIVESLLVQKTLTINLHS